MTGRSENTPRIDSTSRRRTAASVRKAEHLAKEGRLDEAARFMERAIAREPSNAVYLTQLASLRHGQGRTDEAIDLATQALGLAGRDLKAQELLLQLYLETGQYHELIDNAKRLIKTSPRSVFARDMLGVAYLQLGQLDKALQTANELIHLDPMDAGNHFKRAILFQQKGDLGKAIREFTRVVELEPGGEIAEDAKDAITSLDSYQLKQIIALAIEDRVFRAKLLRDAENAAVEKGFFLSSGGIYTLKQIDFDALGDPATFPGETQTYH